MPTNPYRRLPSVNEILDAPASQSFLTLHPRNLILSAVRQELADLRQRLAQGEILDGEVQTDQLAKRVEKRLAAELQPKLRRVINATGIVLHTNLGRAPVAEAAALAARDAARGYLNLELDLNSGKRSSRQDAIREWIVRLTGAESATAVNNNAAATVIALRALCPGKEVIISRGQLIEIGGSFRIPEIMAVSGAILREVGTTNITRLADYEKAIGPNTGALLQIHTSNYRVSGFTESVPLLDLIELGKKHQIKVIDDIGSGAMIDFARFGFESEPVAKTSVAAGADLVLFSGDKLLGGPQAGILAGKNEWIKKIEKDPLMRAFRLDKMSLAALEATLRIYLDEDKALREIPVLRMLGTPLDQLQDRAEHLAQELMTLTEIAQARVIQEVAFVGGGSLPDQKMASWVVEVEAKSVGEDDFAHRLREGNPAVMVRLRDGKLLFDVRTIFPEQMPALVPTIKEVLK